MSSAGGATTYDDHGATAGLLEVRDLAFAYPDGRQVLYGVDLTVTPGERVAILGPTAPARRPWCCT